MSFAQHINFPSAPRVAPPVALRESLERKLASSGLQGSVAKSLKYQIHTAKEAQALNLPVAKPGFLIPYFDTQGNRTTFWRYRYFEPAIGELDRAAGQRPMRYVQAARTVNELYLPPLLDWSVIARDPSLPLVITEGELKAACACSVGVPTIGLGGVWCFRSSRAQVALLPSFMAFQWTGRPVTIFYDADAASNPLVAQAENALARELTGLGAEVFVGRCPALPGVPKTGLDDLVVVRGPGALTEALERARPWAPAAELFRLNEEVVYVEDPGLVLKLENLQRLAPRAFVEHAYAPRTYTEIVASGAGTRTVEKSAPKEWLKWPLRSSVRRATYLPGQPRITGGELNVWRGWGCEPKKGDVKPWKQLLDFLFKDVPAEDRQWFERWLAYPIQFPGTKLYTAAVMWSRVHGVGKSLIGYSLGRVYGTNFVEIQDADLESSFNEWAENKQFVLGDEITGGDKRHVADRLKSMITQKQLRLNPKYVPSYSVPDCLNYLFTSNHPDAFFLEDTDRRFFIHEVKGQPLSHAWYSEVYVPWLDAGGASALFHHLLTLDLGDFKPGDRAPSTRAKLEMIADGRSDLGEWVARLRDDPDSVLRVDGQPIVRSMMSAPELLSIYDPRGTGKVTSNGLSRELKRAGFDKVYGGMGLPTAEGQTKLWAVRNTAELLKSSGVKLRQIYETERGIAPHSVTASLAKKKKSKF